MNSHLIEFSTLLVLFTLAYHFVLRQNKNYVFLRIYCITSVLIAILLPLLPSIFPAQLIRVGTLLPQVTITADQGPILISESTTLSSGNNILFAIYFLVAACLAVRFLLSMITLFQIISKGSQQSLLGFEVLLSDKIKEPCSVFNYILLPQSIPYDQETSKTILEHERLHIKYGHTAEKLFLEVMRIFFWFHPAIWYLKKEIQLIHEYQVDAAMSTNTDYSKYQTTLIQLATKQNSLTLVNPFASQIKKRITMMNSKKNFTKSSYLFLALLLVGGSLFLHACQKDANTSKNTVIEDKIHQAKKADLISDNNSYHSLETKITTDTTIVFNEDTYEEKVEIVKGLHQRAPLFPGCDEGLGFQEMIDCSNERLLNFIYFNLKYPEQARNKNIEGMVVTKLLINKNGNLDDFEILRSADANLTSAVEDVVNQLKAEITWIPGLKNGDQNVNAEFVLPVKFKLQ